MSASPVATAGHMASTDPDRSMLYLQSEVPHHAELSWILGTMMPIGVLIILIYAVHKHRGRRVVQVCPHCNYELSHRISSL